MTNPSETLRAAFGHHRAGRTAEAETLYREILRGDPNQPDALFLLGVIAHDSGFHEEAVGLIGRAVTADPSRANFHFNLGEAYRKLRRWDEARSSYERALRIDPRHLTAHNSLGIVHQERGEWPEAEARFRAAAELGPDQPFVLNNLGAALLHRGNPAEAEVVLSRALGLRPDYPDARVNLGGVYLKLGRYAEAQACFEAALSQRPGYALAYHNLGVVLHKNGRLREAEGHLRESLRLNPRYAPSHFVLGSVLKDGLLLDEARDSLERAVQLAPDLAEPRKSLANVFGLMGRVAEARATLADLAAVRPEDALRLRDALTVPVIYESAEQLQRERRRFEDALTVLSGEALSVNDPYPDVGLTPFYLAYQGLRDRDLLASLAAVHLKAAPGLGFEAAHCRGARPVGAGGRIRVGFLSMFFYDHSIGKLNAGFVRGLSRDRFEVTLLRFSGPDDALARSLRGSADRVVELPRSLDAARRMIADERLDVLYYADVGMDPLTYFLAFARLARVQCVGWGHPVTSGIPAVDYFLTGGAMEPEGADGEYTERLVRFRNVNTCYDEPTLPSSPKTRADFGLDAGSHVYACAQSLFKFHPDFDGVLAGILRGDPDGVLVLLTGSHPNWDRLLAGRFRRAFPAEADRVRFLPRLSHDDFLGLQAAADVLLDTFPFGGGVTSLEALAFGTPVVTLPGEALRGRLTFAFYQQMGILDCVATSPAHYVELALRLANDPAWRAEVRLRILDAKHRLYGDPEPIRELERFLLDAVGAPS